MKYCGRDFRLAVEYPADSGTFIELSGEQSSSIVFGNEQVDTTSKDSMPFRQLKNCGLRTLNMTASGIVTDDTMQSYINQLAVNGSIVRWRAAFGSGYRYIGLMQISALERTGDHNNAEGYSISLASSLAQTRLSPPITYENVSYENNTGSFKISAGKIEMRSVLVSILCAEIVTQQQYHSDTVPTSVFVDEIILPISYENF